MPRLIDTVDRGAVISECQRYRYHLWRIWDESLPRICWVMLNPSTADSETDDPTIRKCMGFARRWGYGAFDVVNLFALRSTDPRGISRCDDPVGPENDHHVREVLNGHARVVVAWGAAGVSPATYRHAASLLVQAIDDCGCDALCLGETQNHRPRHPLMLGYAEPLRPVGVWSL